MRNIIHYCTTLFLCRYRIGMRFILFRIFLIIQTKPTRFACCILLDLDHFLQIRTRILKILRWRRYLRRLDGRENGSWSLLGLESLSGVAAVSDSWGGGVHEWSLCLIIYIPDCNCVNVPFNCTNGCGRTWPSFHNCPIVSKLWFLCRYLCFWHIRHQGCGSGPFSAWSGSGSGSCKSEFKNLIRIPYPGSYWHLKNQFKHLNFFHIKHTYFFWYMNDDYF